MSRASETDRGRGDSAGDGEMIDLLSPALARRSDPSTSHDAAANVPVNEIAAQCLDAIRSAPDGLTATEISNQTGIERDTVSPRLPELVRARLIRDSGRKRKPEGRNRKAIVWEAVP